MRRNRKKPTGPLVVVAGTESDSSGSDADMDEDKHGPVPDWLKEAARETHLRFLKDMEVLAKRGQKSLQTVLALVGKDMKDIARTCRMNPYNSFVAWYNEEHEVPAKYAGECYVLHQITVETDF